jgi:hypothetical protein
MAVERHPVELCQVEGCFACKCATISFGAAATPGRREETASQVKHEKTLVSDLAAYKRLRKEGLQPPSTTNAATLERLATTKTEIERGKVYETPKLAREIETNYKQLKADGVLA